MMYWWLSGVTGSQVMGRSLPGGVGSPFLAKLTHMSSMLLLMLTWSSGLFTQCFFQ